MREALDKVSGAVATKTIVPALTHYLVRDGLIHASNGHITAAAPFPCADTFAVVARNFEDVLRRLPDPVKLTLDDPKWIQLTARRCRGRVARNATIEGGFLGPTGEEIAAPANLVDKMRVMRPFISDNASQPFATCLCLNGSHMYATNNVALVVTDDAGLPDKFYAMVNCFAVDYILSRKEKLTHLQHDAGSISFFWSDGSWMRSQLLDIKFPAIEAIVDTAADPDFELTDEWKAAFDTAAAVAESCVRIYADRIVGGSGAIADSPNTNNAEVEVECTSPVPEDRDHTAWHPKFLAPVIAAANYWKPEVFPKPAPFAGDEVYGVILGRTND